jgi:hypothetical protein
MAVTTSLLRPCAGSAHASQFRDNHGRMTTPPPTDVLTRAVPGDACRELWPAPPTFPSGPQPGPSSAAGVGVWVSRTQGLVATGGGVSGIRPRPRWGPTMFALNSGRSSAGIRYSRDGLVSCLVDVVAVQEVAPHPEPGHVAHVGSRNIPVAGDHRCVLLVEDRVEDGLVGQARWPRPPS